MKILTVIAVMGAGGAETIVEAVSRDTVRRGHQVVVASSGGFRAEALAADGIPHLEVTLEGRDVRALLRSIVALRRSIRRDRPDLIHAHNVKAALVVRLAAGRSTPIVVTVHGVPDAEYAAAARLLRRCADRVVAVSEHVAEQLERHGLPAERITLVENSISVPPAHDRAGARRRLGLPDGTPVAVCVARLAEQKRHDLLLEAWAKLPSDWLLLLAGDGPTRPQVEEAVRRLGLTDRVQVLGERRDVDVLLAAADLMVLPTDWEGMPISMLEAMGAGVPVVVSRVGGVVETLGEGVLLVDPGSAPALADALDAAFGDRAALAELGARGQALVRERYAPELMLHAYSAIYADAQRGVTG